MGQNAVRRGPQYLSRAQGYHAQDVVRLVPRPRVRPAGRGGGRPPDSCGSTSPPKILFAGVWTRPRTWRSVLSLELTGAWVNRGARRAQGHHRCARRPRRALPGAEGWRVHSVARGDHGHQRARRGPLVVSAWRRRSVTARLALLPPARRAGSRRRRGCSRPTAKTENLAVPASPVITKRGRRGSRSITSASITAGVLRLRA